MTSIGELFPKCRKLAYDARQQLAVIQQNRNAAISELFLVLEELNRQLDSMDELVNRETPNQRQVWKHKIQELRHECTNLQTQGKAAEYNRRMTTNSYQQEREELLLRRRRKGRNNGEEESDMQNLAEESQSLEQSQNMVLDLLSNGHASLTGLIEQRQKLRGIRRIVADIGNRLGLSQSTMRIIERRDITDAYLVAAGMVVTLIVIYFVWF